MLALSPLPVRSPPFPGRRSAWRFHWCAIVAVLAALVPGSMSECLASDISATDPLIAKLNTPIRSVQDGKPLRDAIGSIAGQVELNWWLDRSVDPTSPVSPGVLQPTVAAALETLAASRGCVTMPVAGVLLIGRPEWVDATAATLLAIEDGDGGGSRADIVWNDLTTPQQAAAQIADSSEVVISPPLPHDLWPAVNWTSLPRGVAMALVLAQFGRRASEPTALVEIESVPATASQQFVRRYRINHLDAESRRTIKQADGESTIRVSRGSITIRGTASAHRLAMGAMLASAAEQVVQAADPLESKFSLKPTRAPAGSLLQSFADAADLTCAISPEAVTACNRVILIEAEDRTLRDLIEQVAEEAGVKVSWEGDRILVSPAATP